MDVEFDTPSSDGTKGHARNKGGGESDGVKLFGGERNAASVQAYVRELVGRVGKLDIGSSGGGGDTTSSIDVGGGSTWSASPPLDLPSSRRLLVCQHIVWRTLL